jgi:hypothetical protein
LGGVKVSQLGDFKYLATMFDGLDGMVVLELVHEVLKVKKSAREASLRVDTQSFTP